MFSYRAPRFIKHTFISFDEAVLSTDHCGLFRSPLHLAASLMPNMAELLETAPIPRDERDQWEVDIKVHMLMKGQFPCIPNWHCDNVPRPAGDTRYDLIGSTDGQRDFTANPGPPMFLWVSDSPTTEFLTRDISAARPPTSHEEVARLMIYRASSDFQRIQPNAWYSMDQCTPHRGRAAECNGWRVFARLTHKSIAPSRPVVSVIRRHCQVYLDAGSFAW